MTETETIEPMYTHATSFYYEGTETFNPGFFAKNLVDCYFFRTLKDTDTIYLYDKDSGIWRPNGEVFIKEKMSQILQTELRQRYYPDVVFNVRARTYVDRPVLATNKIAVLNGILNVETGELTAFRPEEFLLVQIPVKYDPQATCPQITQFLTEVVGQDQIPILEEMIGYCLLQSLPIHKALMLIGEGANGKSTLIELINNFLGPTNVSHVTLQDLCRDKFSIAVLYGKLANTCADLPSETLSTTGKFKILTGNDYIDAQHKYEPHFSFINHAKLIFSANKVPESLDDTLAFFRRWIIISCNNVFTGDKCDPKKIEKISTPEELSGLLNIALKGLKRLLERGEFSITETLEEMRGIYIKKSNSARAFIEEKLEYTPEADAILTKEELYEKYIEYCNQNNLPSTTKGKLTENIHQYLPQAKLTQRRMGEEKQQTHVWQYIKEKTEEKPAEEARPENKDASVTGVTSPLTSSTNITNNENSLLATVSRVVTPVTPVTLQLEKPTTCFICLKPLPEDLRDVTIYDGKTVHVPCFLKLKEGLRSEGI